MPVMPNYELRAKIAKMRDDGCTYREIAAALGCSYQHAHYVCTHPLKSSESKLDFAIRYIKNAGRPVTIQEVAYVCECSEAVVRTALTMLGCKRKIVYSYEG